MCFCNAIILMCIAGIMLYEYGKHTVSWYYSKILTTLKDSEDFRTSQTSEFKPQTLTLLYKQVQPFALIHVIKYYSYICICCLCTLQKFFLMIIFPCLQVKIKQISEFYFHHALF